MKERITTARLELFRAGKAANDCYKVVGLSDNAGNKSRVSTCGGAQTLDNAAFFSLQTSVSGKSAHSEI